MSPVLSRPVAMAPDLSVVTISNVGKSCPLLLTGGSGLLVNSIADLKPSAIPAAGNLAHAGG
jgi:hypothetical protein